MKNIEFTPTRLIILQMALFLPKIEESYFILFLNNYFTSIPLFLKLRAENINAVRIIRSQDIEFPALLITLRQK